jgi:hypothetical protein
MKNGTRTCPVCDREFEDEGGVRTHLLVGHHKSDMADKLVSTDAESEERKPVTPRPK